MVGEQSQVPTLFGPAFHSRACWL